LDKPYGVLLSLEIQKLDRKTKERARMMYFGDYHLEDISEILNIDLDTVRFYVFGENGSGSNEYCWFQIKKHLNPTSVAAFIKDKIDVLDKTAGIGMNIINENLRRVQNQMLEDSSFTLSIDDTKKLAGIVVDMDKIVRLESGKATDIIDNIAHMSIADARRILAEDPFAPKTVEVWGEVVEDEEESQDTDDESTDDVVTPEDSKIEVSIDLATMEKPWK
jgi:hypothetical protein